MIFENLFQLLWPDSLYFIGHVENFECAKATLTDKPATEINCQKDADYTNNKQSQWRTQVIVTFKCQ